MERRIADKTLRFVLVLIPIIGLSLPLTAGFKYNLNYSSSYVWRGFDLNPTQKMVLQPSVDYVFGKSGLALNIWGSFSFVNREAHEIDLTLSYTFKTSENLRLRAGFTHYGWYVAEDFSLENDTSQEIFVSAGLPNLVTHPLLTVFYDFTYGDGFYLLLETAHSIHVTQSIHADLSASLGYNGGQWLAEGVDPGFSDLNIGLAVSFELKDWNITPFANYTFVLLDALGNENYFWFGIGVGYKKKPFITPNRHR